MPRCKALPIACAALMIAAILAISWQQFGAHYWLWRFEHAIQQNDRQRLHALLAVEKDRKHINAFLDDWAWQKDQHHGIEPSAPVGVDRLAGRISFNIMRDAGLTWGQLFGEATPFGIRVLDYQVVHGSWLDQPPPWKSK